MKKKKYFSHETAVIDNDVIIGKIQNLAFYIFNQMLLLGKIARLDKM